MTVLLGSLVLGLFVVCCVCMVGDVWEACADAQRELELDALWDEDEPQVTTCYLPEVVA